MIPVDKENRVRAAGELEQGFLFEFISEEDKAEVPADQKVVPFL